MKRQTNYFAHSVPRHLLFLGFPVFLLVLLVSWLTQAQQIQAQQTEYDGLDIVFIIDQSGSMQRADGSDAPNDPLGLRFYAPWYAMYWMGEDRLLVHEDITFRMAIVNFGSPGNYEVWDFGNGRYWQEIAPDSRAAWEPVYNDLQQQIQGDMRDRFLVESLGATSFTDPFTVTKTLFNQLPEPEGQRRRVIILLTDGQPSGPIGGPSINLDTHMAELQVLANREFPEPDYLIYVISMIDARQSYWDNVEPYWEAITNDPCKRASCPNPDLDRASIVANNDDVGGRFQEILQLLVQDFPKPENLIVIESEVIPGPLIVPPYLQSVNFTFFKTTPLERLILTDPSGNEISLGQPNVTIEGENGPIQAIRISNPEPGKWFVATDPPKTDVDITMRQIFAKSRLDSPLKPQVQYLPVSIEYTLLDELGANLPFYVNPDYRLIVNATISANGQSWPVQLREEQGYIYKAEFTPVIAATHIISVHAKSQDLNGNPIIVFNNQIGDFEVEPATLAPLSLPGQMQQYDETEFVFELQDSRGFPINAIIPIEVVVEVTGEPGGVLTLTRRPDGAYQAPYTPLVAGKHAATVRATVTDSEGTVFDVAQDDLGEFDVLLTSQVGIYLTDPQTAEQEHTGLWPLDKIPLVVEVVVRDENGSPVDANRVFLRDAASAIDLILTDEKGIDVSHLLTLTLTTEPGVYRAGTSDVELGKYVIHAEAVGDLQVGYLYDKAHKTAAMQVTRIRHPLHIPILISTILALIAITAVTYILLKRRHNITKHPCTGRVYLVDYSSVPQWQHGLDGHNRNHIVLKGGFPSITRVSKMEFRCVSEEDNKNGRVQAQVWIDGAKAPAIDRLLGPKGEARVGTLNFWLLKDPTDEQLSRNRMGATDREIPESAKVIGEPEIYKDPYMSGEWE